jgi:hypothetical protein
VANGRANECGICTEARRARDIIVEARPPVGGLVTCAAARDHVRCALRDAVANQCTHHAWGSYGRAGVRRQVRRRVWADRGARLAVQATAGEQRCARCRGRLAAPPGTCEDLGRERALHQMVAVARPRGVEGVLARSQQGGRCHASQVRREPSAGLRSSPRPHYRLDFVDIATR